jgi:soluble lytic murein transglycosylase-like protein
MSFHIGLGLSERLYLPALLAVAAWTCVACTDPAPPPRRMPAAVAATGVRLTLLEDRVQSWRLPMPAAELRGLRLLYDTPLSAGPTLAVVHSIVRSNHRLDPFDALQLATVAVARAQERGLDPGFFCATLLQESAFAPDALSPAGAVGIAQFTLDTADGEGVDPFDWADAIRGSAALLGRYVAAYDGVYPDPYAAALAAYNAGPGAVDEYHGVPPYAETRAYVADVYDRWARIEHDATGPGAAGRQQARR